MTPGESDKGGSSPVNDSIDELLDGLPAEPILPKRRAKPIDPPPPASDPGEAKVVVSDTTDPRERARREAEIARREGSTFGTAFIARKITRQRALVGFAMMLAVLGIYAFVRHALHHDTTSLPTTQNMQTTSNVVAPMAPTMMAPSALPTALASDEVPTVPQEAPSAEAAPAHKTKSHSNADLRGAKSAASSNNARSDVARSL